MKEILLVVDDSKIVRNLIKSAIGEDYEIKEAENGNEALQIVVDNMDRNIVGMLLDLNMPESDGFYVLEYFKNYGLFKQVPVAIISGEDTKVGIEKTFEYNIVDMLNKPFTKGDVKNVVNRLKNFKIES